MIFCTPWDNLSLLSLESTKACLYLSSIIYHLPGLFGGGSTFPFPEVLRSPELRTERRGHSQCWQSRGDMGSDVPNPRAAWSQVSSLPEISTYLSVGRDYLVADLLVKTRALPMVPHPSPGLWSLLLEGLLQNRGLCSSSSPAVALSLSPAPLQPHPPHEGPHLDTSLLISSISTERSRVLWWFFLVSVRVHVCACFMEIIYTLPHSLIWSVQINGFQYIHWVVGPSLQSILEYFYRFKWRTLQLSPLTISLFIPPPLSPSQKQLLICFLSLCYNLPSRQGRSSMKVSSLAVKVMIVLMCSWTVHIRLVPQRLGSVRQGEYSVWILGGPRSCGHTTEG